MDKDRFVPNDSNDEISLLDILKIIWKYRWFIITFCIIITLVTAIILYTSTIKQSSIPQYTYIAYINLPGISYNLFQYLDIQLKYDLNQGYLADKFFIKELSLEVPELKAKPYKINDFPVVQLKINASFAEEISTDTLTNIEKYVQDLLFQKKLLDAISILKDPVQSSGNIIFSENNIQNAELVLFFTEVNENLISIFKLKNNDINKTYNLVSTYINNLNPQANYLKYAKEIFIKICENNYSELSSLKLDVKKRTTSNNIFNTSYFTKVFIAFFCALVFSIFLIFVIDFFKKHGKEIVK
jgi:LPS O-antigen subunit length determinant protein (WzzB/FepE family)